MFTIICDFCESDDIDYELTNSGDKAHLRIECNDCGAISLESAYFKGENK